MAKRKKKPRRAITPTTARRIRAIEDRMADILFHLGQIDAKISSTLRDHETRINRLYARVMESLKSKQGEGQ
jgi:hypothetical protein